MGTVLRIGYVVSLDLVDRDTPDTLAYMGDVRLSSQISVKSSGQGHDESTLKTCI